MLPIKSIFNTILLSAVVFYSACVAGENINFVKGEIVYTNGDGGINAISIDPSGIKISSLYRSEEVASIENLTSVNTRTLLFGECPIEGECTIKQFSLDKGQPDFIRTGRLPSYISNHEKLFFYDKASDGNNWLFYAPLKNIRSPLKVAKEPKWKILPNGIKQSITTPVIQISNNDVIFVGEDMQLWKFNISDKKLIPLNIYNCRPVFWRYMHNQLLCLDWGTWSPFLLDLSNKTKIEIPKLKGAYGFVYIPENDALIYGRTRSKYIIDETYDIFLFSLIDKKEKRIRKDSHIATGVWNPKKEKGSD